MSASSGRSLLDDAKVVAIGGGTGLPVILKAVKDRAASVAAVVTMADDGGSSGRLRREFGVLPPGDVRNCLVALAPEDSLAAQLFQYRFIKGEGLVGHSLGNILITALDQMTGDFYEAIKQAEKLVGCRGRVLPSTLDTVTLHAEMMDGNAISGQWRIARTRKLKKVHIEPAGAEALSDTIEAIEVADLILIGPGSLFTSIMPNLLVKGIARALKRSKATRVFVVNVANQRGETESFAASDYLRAIGEHLGELPFDAVLANSEVSRLEGPVAVALDDELDKFGVTVLAADLTDEEAPLHHHPAKLGAALEGLS